MKKEIKSHSETEGSEAPEIELTAMAEQYEDVGENSKHHETDIHLHDWLHENAQQEPRMNPVFPAYEAKTRSIVPVSPMSAEFTRPRNRTTPHQLDILEKVAQTILKPDKPLRQKLSNELGMTQRQVQIWFQNKRAKLKKNKEMIVRSDDGYKSTYLRGVGPKYSVYDQAAAPPPFPRKEGYDQSKLYQRVIDSQEGFYRNPGGAHSSLYYDVRQSYASPVTKEHEYYNPREIIDYPRAHFKSYVERELPREKELPHKPEPTNYPPQEDEWDDPYYFQGSNFYPKHPYYKDNNNSYRK
ncbi:hypothetical protein ENBRE01_1127 [Enteropsectra breve]|nr:hypothetical protein ENBRE01_1127 [Enteropsectra breve]